jgi:uncharacterized membrane protein HdeD (DUF308 family)
MTSIIRSVHCYQYLSSAACGSLLKGLVMGNAIKHWWISLVLGVLFILVGICVLVTPLTSYTILSILFSITFFANGILEIFFAIANKERLDGWGWQFTGGVIDLLLGVILLSIPGISMLALPVFVGFGLIFRSMIIMGLSFDLRIYHVPGWGWLLSISLLAMFFSFLLMWNPVFTTMAFFGVGIFRILLSLKLKTLHTITRI